VRAIDNLVLEQLRGDPQLASVVFEGATVTGSPARYVVVWANGGSRASDRFEGSEGNLTKTYTVHSVGLTPEQAKWVQERVDARLRDFRPVLAGRNFQRVKHPVSRPVAVDRDANPVVHYMVDQYDLFSTPGRQS
jgi:hypothetical protein